MHIWAYVMHQVESNKSERSCWRNIKGNMTSETSKHTNPELIYITYLFHWFLILLRVSFWKRNLKEYAPLLFFDIHVCILIACFSYYTLMQLFMNILLKSFHNTLKSVSYVFIFWSIDVKVSWNMSMFFLLLISSFFMTFPISFWISDKAILDWSKSSSNSFENKGDYKQHWIRRKAK